MTNMLLHWSLCHVSQSSDFVLKLWYSFIQLCLKGIMLWSAICLINEGWTRRSAQFLVSEMSIFCFSEWFRFQGYDSVNERVFSPCITYVGVNLIPHSTRSYWWLLFAFCHGWFNALLLCRGISSVFTSLKHFDVVIQLAVSFLYHMFQMYKFEFIFLNYIWFKFWVNFEIRNVFKSA